MAMDMEMDLGAPCVGRARTPDSDTDTPPRNPPMKRYHHSPNSHAPGVYYKECMKNHAASIGGHALDGCCEFMPGPTFTPLDPTSLKCAACGCHRNFHRRDPDDPTPLNHHPIPARRAHSPPSASQLLLSLSQSPSGPSDEVNPPPPTTITTTTPTTGVLVGYPTGGQQGGQNGNFTCGSSSNSKKRHRTKFTAEQKEKMYDFSEKIGWKLKKGEEKLVEEFVKEIGVGRSVFKVWMHNNKHTKQQHHQQQQQETALVAGHAHVVSSSTSGTTLNYVAQQQHQQHHHHQQHSTAAAATSNNGINVNSSSSATNNNVAGNCGASVVVDHHHHHHHHRQFNFANGGGQEAAQAQ